MYRNVLNLNNQKQKVKTFLIINYVLSPIQSNHSLDQAISC
ncbi:hypothetical protein APA_2148 [Pseudanabaena sp. lw0831]|nr:hypothetical protein APA_2148 [Pseudanabaena sp. lw0831]